MPNDIELLRGGRYTYEPTRPMMEEWTNVSPPSPAATPQASQPDPSYAALLAEAQANEQPDVASSASSMAPMAAPARQKTGPGTPGWMTPKRKQMYDEALRAYSDYHGAVAARRMGRKHGREYNKLYNAYQNEIGNIEVMDNMLKTYPKMFPNEDPNTFRLKRDKIARFEKAQKMESELRGLLQKRGIKIGPQDELPEDPFGTDEGDEAFDQFIKEGYINSRLSPYGGE